MQSSDHNSVKPEHFKPSFRKETWVTFLLSLPLIAGQVGQMLTSVADTVMVARIGKDQLAASSFANAILIMPFLFGVGFLISISVRVSQARGAGRGGDVSTALRHGTWAALCLGLIVLSLIVCMMPFLGYLGQPTEVVALTPTYLFLCAVSLVPAYMIMGWKNFADALNRPWVPFWILMSGVGLNIFLNWLLIFGKLGFPELGLDGAGWATLLSRCYNVIFLYFWITRSRGVKQWAPAKLRAWWGNWDRSEFSSLVKLGIPMGFQLIAEITAFSLGAVLIGFFGVVSLAAHQLVLTCVYVAAMFPVGVAMALTVRIGAASGAEREIGKKRTILLGGWSLGALFTVISTVVLIVFRQEIAGMMVTEPEVLELAVKLLMIAGCLQVVDGMQIVSFAALRGMGDVTKPAWLSAFSFLVFALPLGAILAFFFNMGAEGIWWGLTAGLALAALLLSKRAWAMAK